MSTGQMSTGQMSTGQMSAGTLGYAVPMEPIMTPSRLDQEPTARPVANETPAAADELLTDELLVEEISIDGMCGFY
jgi:mycofactocin precursor